MNVAYSLIRSEPHYRADAFCAGLLAAGFEVKQAAPASINPGDVLLIWNRYDRHELACRFEMAGGTVLVAENGYIGIGGVSPHSMKVREPYALARGWHNDATVIPEGGPERWNALGVDLEPWRATGEHILVCPNRPFGAPGRAMPPDWPGTVCRKLRALTKREVRLRPHPGNNAPAKPLAEDLAGAWAVVIWSSSAGVHALVAGVPVICEAPYWICRDATGGTVDNPAMPDRLSALRRLAWGQWSLAEIASGEAFAHLLCPA